MPLQIYNTLTRKKEPFQPLSPSRVSFYNCGPTVYGPFHIGNARNFVVVDVMRRWLEASGYHVHFVQNLTDVDDKIIAQAEKEGITSAGVAEKYTRLFFEHAALLGIRKADEHPKATQYIPAMIELIRRLMDRGHAYTSDDGSVWFEVKTFPGYGKLSGKDLEQMRQGDRVNEEQQRLKRDPADFALWKAAKPGEPFWESPWGKGRPGWHIECSCMAMACHKAPTIDIHSGGVDLTFPHHENEIAQSEGSTGVPFARYWVHNGFLKIDGEKMAKSLGNFKNIDGLLQHYDGLALRHFLLTAHYRAELDLTKENLDQARTASQRYARAQREAQKTLGSDEPTVGIHDQDQELNKVWAAFQSGLDDDFNTPVALAALYETTTLVNKRRALRESDGEGEHAKLEDAVGVLAKMRAVLGLTRDLERAEEGLGDLAEQLLNLLIDVRGEARKTKQFALADLIRQRLGDLGITLEDKATSTIARRGGS